VRRLATLVIAAVAATGLAGAVAPTAAHAAPSTHVFEPATATSRGLNYAGLAPGGSDSSVCGDSFAFPGVSTPEVPRCTHGPDPAPPGIDITTHEPTLVDPTARGFQAAGGVPCYGDGVSGSRVQAIYVHASDVADRYSSLLPSFRQWAVDADGVFNASAAETGGTRHLRFVTDGSCQVSVADVQLSAAGDDNMSNTINELSALGYKRTDRKYLVWVDANVYCGIGQIYGDDSVSSNNLSNGSGSVPGEVARVDAGCWGLSSSNQSIEAHELLHTLGGVQTSAPHSTKYNHCWDESDRMCYDDGSGTAMQFFCPSSHENRFDCNHDDYFSTNPPGGSYLATHWNVANSSFLAQSDSTSTPPPAAAAGAYRSLTPARVLDTRPGSGKPYAGQTLGPDQTLDVQVTGVGGVPSGATAVVLNVTVTNPTTAGYLTLFPTGASRPMASNLNFLRGQTNPNMVQVQLGTGGKLNFYNSSGNTDVIADVQGYFVAPSGTAGLFNPVVPARVLDTRNGSGLPYAGNTLLAGGALSVKVAGVGGVPATGVSAVVLNVTVTNTTAPGYVTAYPSNVSRPLASSLNFVAGQTVPNRVTVPLGPDGSIVLFNSAGISDLIADVGGWYTDGSSSTATGSTFTGMTPLRITDTRAGAAYANAGKTLKSNGIQNVLVAGMGSVPAMSASKPPKAVVVNVTATNTSAGSYLTVYPGKGSRPTASDLNWQPGMTIPNLVVVKLGADGTLDNFNLVGNVDVVVDVVGWYS
jgi:hypothetical protein